MKKLGSHTVSGKMLCLLLAAALCAGVTVGLAAGASAANDTPAPTAAPAAETAEASPSPAARQTDAGAAPSKAETVYVIAGADGSVSKVIVSDWLKNPAGSDTLEDSSELTDITNVNGDETYTMGSGSSLVWNTQGNDIYYQGSVDKELPVGVSVSYELDGKAVSAEDLAGKSGRVTIRFSYDNRQYEEREIDGQTEKIYVPFTMLTGLMLNNSRFTDIAISNGKLISDGDNTYAVGFAFPKLKESLGLSGDALDIPETVEITADVTDFALETSVTLASNDLFNDASQEGEDKLDASGKLDDLTGSLSTLSDAVDQLADGSSSLYDGLVTLLDKSGDLIDGLSQLADGTSALKDGTNAMMEGLGTLQSNNTALQQGAGTVYQSILDAANSQLSANAQLRSAGITVPTLTADNYASVLSGVIGNLSDANLSALASESAYAQASAYVNANWNAIVRQQVEAQATAQVTSQVTQAVQAQVLAGVLQTKGMTVAAYNAAVAAGQVDAATQKAVSDAVDAQMATAAIQSTISAQVAANMPTSAQIDALTAQAVSASTQADKDKAIGTALSDPSVSAQVDAAIAQGQAGRKSLEALKTQLDSYNTFYYGLLSYTDGVAKAYLSSQQLDEGAASVLAGILTLKSHGGELIEGETQLRDGAMTLSEGMNEFRTQGLDKLSALLGGDAGALQARIDALKEVSSSYDSFAGCADGMDGSVQFVFRTDAIGD